MLGVSFSELWHAIRMISVFCILIAAAFKMGSAGDMLIDPTTLEVGSPDWAQYVRDNFSHLNS
jgi:hypothetical protein